MARLEFEASAVDETDSGGTGGAGGSCRGGAGGGTCGGNSKELRLAQADRVGGSCS